MPEKNLSLNNIRAHDLCHTIEVLYDLSYIKPTGS